MKLVIVESPTKATTIKKYLGKEYRVESCMGHIRDLPRNAKEIPEKYKKKEWANLGVDIEHDFAPLYFIPKEKQKVVTELRKKIKDCKELYLATDEDREGESISWHILEVLKPKIPIKRMVFHEITKEAIEESLKNTRKLNDNLVHAQEARRVLDRLVGYSLSPVLWKNIAYGLSAGRVQSVAVKLIVEKEYERLRFVSTLFLKVTIDCKKSKEEFTARLTHYKDKVVSTSKDYDPETGKVKEDMLGKVLVLTQSVVKDIETEVKKETLIVDSIDEKIISKQPSAPFITSTLQQDANRKLNFTSKETMGIAQKLYEQGLITYMRTDSKNLSAQALKESRNYIEKEFGTKYLPQTPYMYGKNKVKGAQEAHEAIRPAGSAWKKPSETKLKGEQLQLYELIFNRTIASQMKKAEQKQVSINIKAGKANFRVSGVVTLFDGFLRVYKDDAEEETSALPNLKKGDEVTLDKFNTTEHETKPPNRYTEAGLIQVLEKEGVGRPSTYASIISTIINRGYVFKQNTTLKPTFTALIVTNLLEKYFPEYVNVGFTSEMENSLDKIAEGTLERTKYLKEVFLNKEGLFETIKKNEERIDPQKARSIKLDKFPDYEFRVGKYGAYVCRDEKGEEVCASVPEEQAPCDMHIELIEKMLKQRVGEAVPLGEDPKTKKKVFLLTGRYGLYAQLGENEDDDKKRTTVPQNIPEDEIDFKKALFLLSLPRELGEHPDTKEIIKLGISRFGPYILYQGEYRSVPRRMDLFSMNVKTALEILATPKRNRKSKVMKELGIHPKDKKEITLNDGKYGPYLKWGRKNVSLPKGTKEDSLTLEEALQIIEDNSK